jgi:3-methyladenine DNA glycosylase Tag
MKSFSEIQLQAEERKGGKTALKRMLPIVPPKSLLLNLPDDRFLAMMTKVINQAGFRWSVVEKKWPQFEDAFLDFNTLKLSFLSPEQWESYMIDTRIVRHWQKICAVRENLSFVCDESRKHDGFAKLIDGWAEDDQVGLMLYLKKHGSRLGGQTGPRFLRYVGLDAFMLTGDVVLAMQNAGIDIADNPTSQRDLKKIQVLMNQWREQSGLPYTHLSKIAAYSTGINYDNV